MPLEKSVHNKNRGYHERSARERFTGELLFGLREVTHEQREGLHLVCIDNNKGPEEFVPCPEKYQDAQHGYR